MNGYPFTPATRTQLIETLEIVANPQNAVYVSIGEAEYDTAEGKRRRCRWGDLDRLNMSGLIYLVGHFPHGWSRVYVTEAGAELLRALE